jgi:hypothetical protein
MNSQLFHAGPELEEPERRKNQTMPHIFGFTFLEVCHRTEPDANRIVRQIAEVISLWADPDWGVAGRG